MQSHFILNDIIAEMVDSWFILIIEQNDIGQ